eukprot:EG_transcript_33589
MPTQCLRCSKCLDTCEYYINLTGVSEDLLKHGISCRVARSDSEDKKNSPTGCTGTAAIGYYDHQGKAHLTKQVLPRIYNGPPGIPFTGYEGDVRVVHQNGAVETYNTANFKNFGGCTCQSCR